MCLHRYNLQAFFDLNTLSVSFYEPVSLLGVLLITWKGVIIHKKCCGKQNWANIARPRYRDWELAYVCAVAWMQPIGKRLVRVLRTIYFLIFLECDDIFHQNRIMLWLQWTIDLGELLNSNFLMIEALNLIFQLDLLIRKCSCNSFTHVLHCLQICLNLEYAYIYNKKKKVKVFMYAQH